MVLERTVVAILVVVVGRARGAGGGGGIMWSLSHSPVKRASYSNNKKTRGSAPLRIVTHALLTKQIDNSY